ncbi:MAG: sulfotransferase [Pseudomonadota bacterium]
MGPDFLIVGAMKCGTSTLAAQLAAQTGVFMTTPKEPNYFSDDDIYAKGPEWYASLFAPASPGDLKGEASTHYTKMPTYPETLDRLAAVLPSPKIIYVIRNPVARAVSHYIHEWTQGVMSGDIDDQFARHPELVDYGRYAMQIRPFLDRFGSENVLLLTQETMRSDPQGLLSEVADFLGRPGEFTWRDDLGDQNVSAAREKKLPLHSILVANPVATALRRTLVPQGLRDWVKERRRMTDRPELTETLREMLETNFTDDFAELRALFPVRQDLTLTYPFVRDRTPESVE